MDSVFRALWLAGYLVLFNDSPPVPPSERRQTRVIYDEKDFSVCCRNKQRNFTKNPTSCSQNTRERWRHSVWKFKQVKLLSDWLEFIDKTDEKVFFCLYMQISLALLHLAHMFINNLKQNGFEYKCLTEFMKTWPQWVSTGPMPSASLEQRLWPSPPRTMGDCLRLPQSSAVIMIIILSRGLIQLVKAN